MDTQPDQSDDFSSGTGTASAAALQDGTVTRRDEILPADSVILRLNSSAECRRHRRCPD
jgi:hypothetical protein